MIIISQDGLVRLTFRELSSMPLLNIYNEIDADYADDLKQKGVDVALAGFTEWCTEGEPAISVGFGFVETVSNGVASLRLAPDPIRCNIQLIDNLGYDLDNDKCNLLALWLEKMDWRTSVGAWIHLNDFHYSN